ncbi:MAG: helix-turn-helix domain-containing protein [Candidatus Woesearchaeota archaeon]
MDLQELGLTQNEAKVYEALLHTGKSGAAEIAKRSGVPYGRIYTVLDSLLHKGLIRYTPEKKKMYIPANPQELSTYIAQKKKNLEVIETKIKEFQTIYNERKPDVVQISNDAHNFHKLIMQMAPATKTSYSIKFDFTTSPEFLRKAKMLVKEKIDYRTLGLFKETTKKNIIQWKKITPHIKSIPNEGVAVSIVDDTEILISLIANNTILLIRDKPFVKLMKKLFLRYYETQPEIDLRKDSISTSNAPHKKG